MPSLKYGKINLNLDSLKKSGEDLNLEGLTIPLEKIKLLNEVTFTSDHANLNDLHRATSDLANPKARKNFEKRVQVLTTYKRGGNLTKKMVSLGLTSLDNSLSFNSAAMQPIFTSMGSALKSKHLTRISLCGLSLSV